jgi:hypothetical protein
MIPIGYPRRIDRPHAAVIFCAPRGPLLATEVAMAIERWKPKREATRQEEFPSQAAASHEEAFRFPSPPPARVV